MSEPTARVNFATFFLLWSEERRWDVPDIHWQAVHWMEHREKLAVLRCFRGFGKSTLIAIYNAWRYYDDPSYRILHQGDQDKTAYKTSRDTKAVLLRHPLTREEFKAVRGEAAFWWVPGAQDERNPSMQAAGITSNITSSRCDEAQNDDVEVPRNIQNPEAREKMRYRLGEQTHCMVPGARQLFIGTPHTHDSLYDEQERMGADCLTIKMYANEHRIENAKAGKYPLAFVPDVVFSGIGEHTQVIRRNVDYQINGLVLDLKVAPGGIVDCYAGSAWPERFTPDEMASRRKKCKTINEWDSQYQLHSRPLHDVRLDPQRMEPYDCEPVLSTVNKVLVMMLGRQRVVGSSCHWDPASGKLHSDASTLAVIFQDETGRRYWHRAARLLGEVAEFSEDGSTIIGGQVHAICQMVEELNLPRVTVETNGIGAFAPAVLRAALKQRRLRCGVVEEVKSANKNRRILEQFEPLLLSTGQLWAHVSVLDGPVWDQMRDWNPAVAQQPDDFIDSGAGAISETPERIQAVSGRNFQPGTSKVWTPASTPQEIAIEI